MKRVLLGHLTDDHSGQALTSNKASFATELLSQLCDVASDEVQEGQGIEVLGLLIHLDATAGCKGIRKAKGADFCLSCSSLKGLW